MNETKGSIYNSQALPAEIDRLKNEYPEDSSCLRLPKHNHYPKIPFKSLIKTHLCEWKRPEYTKSQGECADGSSC